MMKMKKKREYIISKEKFELLVKKVFICDFNWKNLEDCLELSRMTLLSGLKEYLNESDLMRVLDKIGENECKRVAL